MLKLEGRSCAGAVNVTEEVGVGEGWDVSRGKCELSSLVASSRTKVRRGRSLEDWNKTHGLRKHRFHEGTQLTHESVNRRDVEAGGLTVKTRRSGGKAASSLESNNYVALARDWICLFAVGGKVVIVPKDVGLRS